jgi:hypothetical protein
MVNGSLFILVNGTSFFYLIFGSNITLIVIFFLPFDNNIDKSDK